MGSFSCKASHWYVGGSFRRYQRQPFAALWGLLCRGTVVIFKSLSVRDSYGLNIGMKIGRERERLTLAGGVWLADTGFPI
jgi:hypothetical protein